MGNDINLKFNKYNLLIRTMMLWKVREGAIVSHGPMTFRHDFLKRWCPLIEKSLSPLLEMALIKNRPLGNMSKWEENPRMLTRAVVNVKFKEKTNGILSHKHLEYR